MSASLLRQLGPAAAAAVCQPRTPHPIASAQCGRIARGASSSPAPGRLRTRRTDSTCGTHCGLARQPVDQAWAFLDDDVLVPVDSAKPWNHIKDGQFGADPNFKVVVADRLPVADRSGHSEL